MNNGNNNGSGVANTDVAEPQTPYLYLNGRIGNISAKLSQEFFRLRAQHLTSLVKITMGESLLDFFLKEKEGQSLMPTIARHFWNRMPRISEKDKEGRKETEYYLVCDEEGARRVSEMKPEIETFLNSQLHMEITSWEIIPGHIRYKLK